MEMNNEDGFLEELLALRREAWEMEEMITSSSTDQINGLIFSPTTWAAGLGFDGLDSSSSLPDPAHFQLPFPSSSSSFSFYPEPEPGFPGPGPGPCKEEEPTGNYMNVTSTNNSTSSGSSGCGKVSKVKKNEGQPSKNLMAERRRRKRLNDRLSMLRSVVPKISKMDRTSILGDTIDYMKELLDRISSLQEEIDVGSSQFNVMSIFKDVKPNDVLVRNSPKFDVERKDLDTRVEICCTGKPGLLLSTVTTLEALGLEIQQCVISCFNDFSLHASCSEEVEQRSLISSEDIKQALFRNAGYGGRCL